jgi:Secretin and TonB N terminus short domain
MKIPALVAPLLCVISFSMCSAAESTYYVDIPAGKLTTALELLARQSQIEFIYSSEELNGLQTRGVQGDLSTREALSRLLEGTGLVMIVHPSGAILITRSKGLPKAPPANPKSRNSRSIELTEMSRATRTEIPTSAPWQDELEPVTRSVSPGCSRSRARAARHSV